MDRKSIGPEAIALACDTIGKCKADTATARRILAQAHAWVCDVAIDPTWKPEAVQPVSGIDPAIVKLGAACTEKDAEITTLRTRNDDLSNKVRGPLRQIRPDAVKAEEWATMPPSTRADAIKSSVADPYADLPPNLREWARQRDASRNPSNLEID